MVLLSRRIVAPMPSPAASTRLSAAARHAGRARPRRGVYRGAEVEGRICWYAVTSSGARLEACRARTLLGESDAKVVVMLADLLDEIDPVRPVLRLVTDDMRPDVTPYVPAASSLRIFLLAPPRRRRPGPAESRRR